MRTKLLSRFIYKVHVVTANSLKTRICAIRSLSHLLHVGPILFIFVKQYIMYIQSYVLMCCVCFRYLSDLFAPSLCYVKWINESYCFYLIPSAYNVKTVHTFLSRFQEEIQQGCKYSMHSSCIFV